MSDQLSFSDAEQDAKRKKTRLLPPWGSLFRPSLNGIFEGK
jgi:hypothetical protein